MYIYTRVAKITQFFLSKRSILKQHNMLDILLLFYKKTQSSEQLFFLNTYNFF